jgi:tRNA G18 (ribose-2'-O)-methylase SpoU
VRTRHVPSALDAVAQLQAAGVRVCAAETVEGSASLYDESNVRLQAALGSPLAIVFGNELVGVDARVLARCDAIIHLPTFGAKNSLNVATCATALVYEILRRWGKLDPARGA